MSIKVKYRRIWCSGQYPNGPPIHLGNYPCHVNDCIAEVICGMREADFAVNVGRDAEANTAKCSKCGASLVSRDETSLETPPKALA